MSETAAALRAAREVEADVRAPELYRQANDWFYKARREYKFKNFKLALEYADRAKEFAERAEFESIRGGANRSEASLEEPFVEVPASISAEKSDAGAGGEPPQPYEYPTPEPVPADLDKPPTPTAPQTSDKNTFPSNGIANPPPVPNPYGFPYAASPVPGAPPAGQPSTNSGTPTSN